VATGSTPIIIPVPGVDLKGVVTYRDLDDVQFMLDAATRSRRAVVIGGGLLGLEAAAGLNAQGMEVTVLHLMPSLMERQLDTAAGALLKKALQARGIEVRTSADTAAVVGNERVTGVRLNDGTEIPADLVVMAVGIRPHASLAKNAGLATNRGIVVDDAMHTSDRAVLAIGECVEHRGVSYGLVAPLYDMAKVAAAQITGDDAELFGGVSTATKLKVTGIDLFSAGDFSAGTDREEIVLEAAAVGIYRRLILQDNRLIGAVLYGQAGDGPWFFDLMRGSIDIAAMRDLLIFGEAYAATPAPSAARKSGGSEAHQSMAA
jgi:nitrite reductase (NADH) large subunit